VGTGRTGSGRDELAPQLLVRGSDVELTSVDVVCGDTDLCPWDMGTFGSPEHQGLRARPCVMRAAEARGVLLAMAAERLQAPPNRSR